MRKKSDVLNPDLNKVPESLSSAEDLLGIMQSIIAEWDAIHLYKALAEATQNSELKDLMNHLVEEELKHVGELEEIAFRIEEDTEKFIDEGHKEFKKRNDKESKKDEKANEDEGDDEKGKDGETKGD